MKLYHATSIINLEEISEYGLRPSLSEKVSFDERLDVEAVYGFDNMEDAVDFITDNEYSEYVIFSFECENAVQDTEYESGAYAMITDKFVKANVELIAE